ncbi:hypothetical protein ACFB49_10830 [Sphingomonas sp. DBB INV C78]|uniref:EF-hand domain-containing protein n=1 Tax=Sphingomonas sp. DBB INV C78 TaxID=3349434 RepID=UPI0036D2BBBB
MKYAAILACAALTMAVPALAGDANTADANGDGKVSKAEFDASAKADWTKMDKDGNGQISAAEAGDHAAKWKSADTNGDGQISADEYMAKKSAWFAKADADKDGTISQAEHHAAMAAKKGS